MEKSNDMAPGDMSFNATSHLDMSFDDMSWAMILKGY